MFALSQAMIEQKTVGEHRNNTSLLSNTKPTTSAEFLRPITRYIVIKKTRYMNFQTRKSSTRFNGK